MTRLVFAGAAGRRLFGFDASFEGGTTAIVADGFGPAGELAELACGITRPRKGSVRVDGHDPFVEPGLRRDVASLLPVEEALHGETVEVAVARAGTFSERPGPAGEVLAAAGLAPLRGRHPATLSSEETRSVALAIALAVERPRVAVFVEPLGAGLERRFVLRRLADFARLGTAVVAIVASERDARDVGARMFSTTIIQRRLALTAFSAHPGGELKVRVDDPRALAKALADHAAITEVELRAGASDLVVRGDDVEDVSLAVLRAAHEHGLAIARFDVQGAAGDGMAVSPGARS